MVSDRKVAHAVGGKSVRACDNCVRKRARWYCAADDAFLCESCDSSVHSANPLARRHERVRLKTASPSNSSADESSGQVNIKASWHQGFTRKARTPRQKKIAKLSGHLVPVPEPELCSEEESEEQLLYRVPVFDQFEVSDNTHTTVGNHGENSRGRYGNIESNELSELDLAEFAADVESLLGKGLEDESFDMEGLGILDGEEPNDCCWLTGNIKAEDEEVFGVDGENQQHRIPTQQATQYCKLDDSNKAFLKLNYDRVMSAWDDTKSPWTTGDRPEISSAHWWTDCGFGTSTGAMHAYGEVAMASGQTAAMGDGGREARVTRYREKRRTRLFSKKIRYEVRKLNAEKRPRMKGRFVKRASFAASAFPLLNK